MVPPARTPIRTDRLRALNTPVPVTVWCDDRGRPIRVAINGNTTVRAVEAIVEHWRIDDEWWRAFVSRRYDEIVLQGGKHLVLFQDLVTETWYAQSP